MFFLSLKNSVTSMLFDILGETLPQWPVQTTLVFLWCMKTMPFSGFLSLKDIFVQFKLWLKEA